MIPPKEKIEGIIKELQKIMRIQDWDIKLEIVTEREMDGIAKVDYIPGGYCSCSFYYRRATIYLNPENEETKKDWYMVLIHEIHHVLTDIFDDFKQNKLDRLIPDDEKEQYKKDYEAEWERLICVLTRAFINAYPVTNFIVEGNEVMK